MTILPYMRSEVAQSCVTLCNPRLEPTRLLHPWNFPGKSIGVGFHFLLQGIFPTQGLNPGLPYCGHMLFLLSHQGSPHLPYICNHSLIYYSWILNSVQLFSHVWPLWPHGLQHARLPCPSPTVKAFRLQSAVQAPTSATASSNYYLGPLDQRPSIWELGE